MFTGATSTIVGINAQTVNGAVTVTSDWVEAKDGFSFNTFWLIANSSTTPHLGLYLDISPFSASSLTKATSNTTLYTPVTLVADLTTKNALQNYMPAVAAPFLSCRLRVLGGGSNGTDTVVTGYLTIYS